MYTLINIHEAETFKCMYTLMHPLTDIGVVWGDDGVTAIIFLEGVKKYSNDPYPPGAIKKLLDSIRMFLDGCEVDFDLSVLDFGGCTEYQRRVLDVVSSIPRGSTLTYSEVAARAGGSPRSAAGALSRNPFPLVIPCHRVIRSDGNAGGYQGGIKLKKRLLEMEGVSLDGQ